MNAARPSAGQLSGPSAYPRDVQDRIEYDPSSTKTPLLG